MSDQDTIAVRLRKSREMAGMTRQQACDVAGVALSTLERWERGTNAPKPAELAKLCEVFQVTADYVLGLSEQPRTLVPGFYLIDQKFVRELLGTENPSEIERLCDSKRGAVVDFGSAVVDGSELVSGEEGRNIERKVVSHIAGHGPKDLKRIFQDYQRDQQQGK